MRLLSLCLSYCRGRRLAALTILGSSLALPLLVQQAHYWHGQHQHLLRQQAAKTQAARVTTSAQDQLQRWALAQAKWNRFATEAARLGWGAGLWEQHSVQVEGKRFSRQEADLLLSSLNPGQDAFMLPHSFSIKLMSPQGSLLIPSRQGDQDGAVMISLKGTYYSRGTP